MAQAPFITSAAEMMGAAMVYNPEGMMQVGADFGSMAKAYEDVASAFRTMVQRANDEDPIHPGVIEQMQVVYGHLAKAAAAADELGPMFRQLHKLDIERIEAPRRNESRWDYGVNK